MTKSFEGRANDHMPPELARAIAEQNKKANTPPPPPKTPENGGSGK